MIYIVFLLVLIAFNKINKSRKDNIFSWLIAIIFILIVGLRGPSVGVDTENYFDYYDMYGRAGTGFLEGGFEALISYCNRNGFPAFFHILLCSILTVIPVMLATNKIDKYAFYIFCYLFFTLSYGTMCNIMRQSVAIAWIFYAICRLSRIDKLTIKEFIIYAALILLASQFHASSIILLPFVLFKIVNLKKNIYLVIYILSCCVYFIPINNIIPTVSFIGRDYTGYADDLLSLGRAQGLGLAATLICNIIIFLLMYRMNAFKKYPLIANAAFTYLCLQNISNNASILSRITVIFQIYSWLLLALLYADMKRMRNASSYESKAFTMVFFVYATLMFYGIISEQNALLPYKFFFE